ncbi:MAG: tetratricopeptide repeat protein [bacterium]
MKCPVCGKECREEDNFCSNCGTRLKASPKGGITLESLDRMIDDFRRKLEDNPKDPNIYYNLALAFAMKGEDEIAMTQLRNVLSLDPSFPDALYLLGKLCLKHKLYEEAKENFRKLLELEPEREDVRKILLQLER